MEIKKVVEHTTLTVEIIGRLDVVTVPDLDEELKKSIAGMKMWIFDLAKLDYIASAGLRLLLKYQKLADKNVCTMKIKNVKKDVREVFVITGFNDFLNIVDNHGKKLSIEF